MLSAPGGSLLTFLSQVPDPRGRKGRRHSLSAMLTTVVCGVLCGNRGYSQLVECGCTNYPLPSGTGWDTRADLPSSTASGIC